MEIGDNRVDKFRIFYYVYNAEQNRLLYRFIIVARNFNQDMCHATPLFNLVSMEN